MRHTLIGFQLIVMICGSKAEASYVCLEDNPHLPPCNFERMQRALVNDDLEKKTRISSGAVMDSLYQAPDGTVVVYKIEGCVPGRLPFTLPICKTEDTAGRDVEVRRLFPFVVSGDPPTAPLIFPEIEAAQLYKYTGDLREKTYNPVISRQDLNLDRESLPKLSRRKKKLGLENVKKNHKHDKTLDAERMETSGMSTILQKYYRRRNDIDTTEGLKKYSSTGRKFLEASFPEYEFPYARAIPYDLGKIKRLLHLPKDSLGNEEYPTHGSEFPYSRAIPFDPEKHKNLLHESEERRNYPLEVPKYFPYDKAISYNPLKLEELLMWLKSHDDLPESKIWKREVVNDGSEFPYDKALPYNHWKVSGFRRRLELRSPSHVEE